MRKTTCFLFILIIFSLRTFSQGHILIPGAPESQKFSSERLRRIDNLVKQYIDSGWIKGADALVARNGVIVYNKAFGAADAEQHVPMKTDAIFRIASQTKAITSVGVMMLFEEGKFLLDDPISKYIPSFAHPRVLDKFNEKDTTYTTVPAKREVTIRDLLTHTAGVDYAQIGSDKMKAIYAKAGLRAGFVSDKLLLGDAINKLGALPLVHQPGERFTYGLNIDVLGYLIEKVSGKSLDRFLRERLFVPLGMNDTYFYVPKAKQDRLVQVYTPDKHNHLEKWNAGTFPGVSADYPKVNGTYYSGGAGLSSTTRDYAIFLQMMLNNGEYNGRRILARHTVEMMTMNQVGDINLDKNKFGLGFLVITKPGQSILGETEGSFSWGGFFGTTYWADPKEHLVCLFFVQEWPFPHGELNDKFRVLVYSALND
jgi:CubicO group peptidase (beta-lactamase class C family)